LCFVVVQGIKRHSAYRSRSVTVEYRWHPLHGKRVPLFRRVGRGPDALVHLDVPAGMSRECPAWMCDAEHCRTMDLGAPQLSAQALIELRRVLLERLATPSTSPPSAERSSGRSPTGEGSDEAEDSTYTSTTGAAAAKRAPNSMARRHTERPDRGARGPASRGARTRRGSSTRGRSQR
jgi:hypothetical protein